MLHRDGARRADPLERERTELRALGDRLDDIIQIAVLHREMGAMQRGIGTRLRQFSFHWVTHTEKKTIRSTRRNFRCNEGSLLSQSLELTFPFTGIFKHEDK
jgi:hypothetical protein